MAAWVLEIKVKAVARFDFDGIGQWPMFLFKFGQAFDAAIPLVNIQNNDPGHCTCGDSDIRVGPLPPPFIDNDYVGSRIFEAMWG